MAYRGDVPDFPRCPFCDAAPDTDQDVFIEATERMFGLGGDYRYTKCGDCGSLALVDVPDDLSLFYEPTAYYSFNHAASIKDILRRLRARAFVGIPKSARLRLPPRFRPTWAGWYTQVGLPGDSHVLDVGCGDGEMLSEMVSAGAISSGVGFDPYFTGDDPPGIRIVRSEIEEAGSEFSHIMLHHSLEHVVDPYELLARAIPLLAEDGVFVVRVPLADSAVAVAFGARWIDLDAPRHVAIPTSAGIHRLADRLGFAVESTFRDGQFLELSGSLAYSMDMTLTSESFRKLVARTQGPATSIVSQLNGLGAGGRGLFVLRRELCRSASTESSSAGHPLAG